MLVEPEVHLNSGMGSWFQALRDSAEVLPVVAQVGSVV